MPKSVICAIWLVSLLAGCAPQFPMPLSAHDVVSTYISEPAALVAFLGQPDPDPDVCDLRSPDDHLPALTSNIASELVDGLTDGRVQPAVWRACVELLMKSAPAKDFVALLDDAGPAYRKLLRDPALESDALLNNRLYELHRLYLQRPAALHATRQDTDPLFEELRIALREKKLGPRATGFGNDLMLAYDLEHDRWRGHPVDLAMIDALFAKGNEAALWKFQARLENAGLREEARRRVIRLHIAASHYPEVKQHSAEIEALLISGKRNAVDSRSTILSAAVSSVPWQMVVARERLETQQVDLFGVDPRDSGLYSAFELRNNLQARVKLVSQPITICAPLEALDPSPCLLPADVSVDSPFARVDQAGLGALQLASKLSMKEALPLAMSGGALEIPFRVGGKLVSHLKLDLRFERPEDLVLVGEHPGQNGPSLDIAIGCPGSKVVSYTIDDGHFTSTAYVEATDVDVFQVQSQGAPGMMGSPGYDGSSGMSGATCQNGGNGGDGGSGGNGGPGGNGGNITLRVLCESGLSSGVGFSMLQKILLRTVTSAGGAGGPGGRGGRGGSGGSGGSSRAARTHVDSHGHTVTDEDSCPAGTSGRSGHDGSNGYAGPDGTPGVVSFAQ